MKAFGFDLKKPTQQEMLGIGLIVLIFLLVAAALSEFVAIDPPHILAFVACVFAGALLSVCGVQPSQGVKAMVLIAVASAITGFCTLHSGRWIISLLG